MAYKFTWDPNKNKANLRDHGVDFRDAVLVFQDADLAFEFDQVDNEGEERFKAIGKTPRGAVLLVVHIYKGVNENGEERVHIISARPPSKREFRRYFQQTAQ